jgi:hypothetical protein
MVRQNCTPAPQSEFKRTLEKLWLIYQKDVCVSVEDGDRKFIDGIEKSMQAS